MPHFSSFSLVYTFGCLVLFHCTNQKIQLFSNYIFYNILQRIPLNQNTILTIQRHLFSFTALYWLHCMKVTSFCRTYNINLSNLNVATGGAQELRISISQSISPAIITSVLGEYIKQILDFVDISVSDSNWARWDIQHGFNIPKIKSFIYLVYFFNSPHVGLIMCLYFLFYIFYEVHRLSHIRAQWMLVTINCNTFVLHFGEYCANFMFKCCSNTFV